MSAELETRGLGKLPDLLTELCQMDDRFGRGVDQLKDDMTRRPQILRLLVSELKGHLDFYQLCDLAECAKEKKEEAIGHSRDPSNTWKETCRFMGRADAFEWFERFFASAVGEGPDDPDVD
jgi:hypothetical protein